MDTETPTTASRKRTTKSSTRRALESTVAQFDELLATTELKEGKRGDVLIAKSNALRELLALEANDRETEAQNTISRLQDQHTSDMQRISALESANAVLRAKPEVVREVLDPEHETVRQKNATLLAVINQITSTLNDTERQVVMLRACQSYANKNISLDVARQIAAACHLSFNEQMQMWFEYGCKNEKALEDIIAQHEVSGIEGGITRFVRALLVVRHGGLASNLTVATRRPDDLFERV